MLAIRWPSWTSSMGIALAGDMACGLLAGDAPEGRADGHADSGDVALAQHVAGHDLACGEDVLRGPTVVQNHLRALVDRDAEVGERDARPQRIGEVRRRV